MFLRGGSKNHKRAIVIARPIKLTNIKSAMERLLLLRCQLLWLVQFAFPPQIKFGGQVIIKLGEIHVKISL